MAWISKKGLCSFLDDIGASYAEFQHEYTWYGRASFRDGRVIVYCDFTLGGADGVCKEDPIIGVKNSSTFGMVPPSAREASRLKFEPQLLACNAALNRNPKLDGAKAEKHAFQITQVTPNWSVAFVKLRSQRWSDDKHYVSYLVANGIITSLPTL